ncbi:MAG: hypothetical protein ACFB3T_11075 [Geminicoccaceae bacterium]
MVARMALGVGLGLVLAMAGALTARASENLCALMAIPAELELDCVTELRADGHVEAKVTPADETWFAPLTSLRVYQLPEPVDDPDAWLRERLVVDLSGTTNAVSAFLAGPDSPLDGNAWAEQLAGSVEQLEAFQDLPLQGCDAPQDRPGGSAREMRCAWPLGPLTQYLSLRYVERDGVAYGVTMRTMNERRLEHLAALANALDRDPG